MTILSLNINKVAVIRNSRGGNYPDVIKFATDCEEYGAEGITVHPRPDGRHIRFDDVLNLKKVVKTQFNIEGYPSKEFIKLVTAVVPTQVTLVPDPPGAITSDAGWDTIKQEIFLKEVISEFKKFGIRVSVFVDPVNNIVEATSKVGADRIELYTGPYAHEYKVNPEKAVSKYVEAANTAHQCKLGINAGHDLNLDNLEFFINKVANVDEVSIGHALISDALYYGISNTILMYKQRLTNFQ